MCFQTLTIIYDFIYMVVFKMNCRYGYTSGPPLLTMQKLVFINVYMKVHAYTYAHTYIYIFGTCPFSWLLKPGKSAPSNIVCFQLPIYINICVVLHQRGSKKYPLYGVVFFWKCSFFQIGISSHNPDITPSPSTIGFSAHGLGMAWEWWATFHWTINFQGVISTNHVF